MKKNKIIALFFLLSFYGCSRTQKIFAFEIPHDYEGFIFVVFNVKADKSTKPEPFRNFIYFRPDSMPIVFINNQMKDLDRARGLMIIDNLTQKDVRLGDTAQTTFRTKVFGHRLDTIFSQGLRYPCVSEFITKDFLEENNLLVHKQLLNRSAYFIKIKKLLEK